MQELKARQISKMLATITFTSPPKT